MRASETDRQTHTYTALTFWRHLGDLPPGFIPWGSNLREVSSLFCYSTGMPQSSKGIVGLLWAMCFPTRQSPSCLRSKPTCAGEAVSCIAVLTETAVRPHGVLTVCVLAAHVGSVRAFIQILGTKVTALSLP